VSGGGRARPAEREAPDATQARDTLRRPGAGQGEPPEPGALRPLARALVDLALTIELEEDEAWTR
jgi:hypothetical protein